MKRVKPTEKAARRLAARVRESVARAEWAEEPENARKAARLLGPGICDLPRDRNQAMPPGEKRAVAARRKRRTEADEAVDGRRRSREGKASVVADIAISSSGLGD